MSTLTIPKYEVKPDAASSETASRPTVSAGTVSVVVEVNVVDIITGVTYEGKS
ncbi:MAG: hypothetical protein ACC656_10975 [Candidatus Heimdallarchaeota archaeon]